MEQRLRGEPVAAGYVTEPGQAVGRPRPKRIGAKRRSACLELVLAIAQRAAQRAERGAYVLVRGDERLCRCRRAVRGGTAAPDSIRACEHQLGGCVREVAEIGACRRLQRGKRLIERSERLQLECATRAVRALPDSRGQSAPNDRYDRCSVKTVQVSMPTSS